MDLTEYFIKLAFFLVPGFISWTVYSILVNRKETESISTVIRAFGCSIVDYMFGNLLIMVINAVLELICIKTGWGAMSITEIINHPGTTIPQENLIAALIVGFPFAFALAKVDSENIIFFIAEKLNITSRSGNTEVWDNLFLAQPWIIYRDLITKHVFYGCVQEYSDKQDIHEILLSNITVWNSDGSESYSMKKVYLARNINEFTIEIADYNKGE